MFVGSTKNYIFLLVRLHIKICEWPQLKMIFSQNHRTLVLVFLLLTNKMKIDNFSVKSYIFCKKTRSGKTDPFGSTVGGVPYQIMTKCKKSDFILTVWNINQYNQIKTFLVVYSEFPDLVRALGVSNMDQCPKCDRFLLWWLPLARFNCTLSTMVIFF